MLILKVVRVSGLNQAGTSAKLLSDHLRRCTSFISITTFRVYIVETFAAAVIPVIRFASLAGYLSFCILILIPRGLYYHSFLDHVIMS